MPREGWVATWHERQDAVEGFQGRIGSEGSDGKQGRQEGCLTKPPAEDDCQQNTITVQLAKKTQLSLGSLFSAPLFGALRSEIPK